MPDRKVVPFGYCLGSQQEEADRYEAMGYLTSLTRKKKGDPELGAAM